jgi:myo-inositol 2-dehydrogenase / D-chiro-inositol 1-dehydrogenase
MGVGLRIGVVGVGRMGAFHARTLVGLDDVASVIVADADAGRAERVAAELGPRARAAESPEAAFAAAVDAVVIAASTPAHAPMLRLAAATETPAFCEKPVALDLDVLDEVIEDVAIAGILVQVGFQRRFDAGYRAAREAVAAGDLGTLLVVRAATHDPAPPTEAYVAASGGIFRDLHIHDFDAVRYVTGQEIVEVYADGAVRETPWFESYHDVDAAVAVMRLSGGALGILSGTRHDPLGYDVRLEVFGASDTIAVGYDARSPIRSVEPGAPEPGTGYRDFLERFALAYRAELAAFLDAVQAQTESACTLAEARAALACALAADRSRAERRPVSVAEVGSARAATR